MVELFAALRTMPHFISAGALTKTQHALFWPSPHVGTSSGSPTAPPGSATLDSLSGTHVVDPGWYVNELCSLYSVPSNPVITARASGQEGLHWWPEWVRSEQTLHRRIGSAVECTEDPTLFHARFVWVGVPFPGQVPREEDVGAETRPFTPCMVSLVTHDHPSDKRAYIWVVVNQDGDVSRLTNEVLERLLAPQIAELKSYVLRTGDRSVLMAVPGGNGIPTDDYREAAKLMVMNVEGIPRYTTPGLLPFQGATSAPTPIPTDGSFMTPVQTSVLPNRLRLLQTARNSIAAKRSTGEVIPHPFLPDNATEEQRDVFKRFLQYVIQYGQYDPTWKDVLQVVPHDDDVASIHADVAFREFVRVQGNLTPQ